MKYDYPAIDTPIPPLKAIQVIYREGVEPDIFDRLKEEMRFALDISRDPFCPLPSRERLRDYAAKCAKLLESQQCQWQGTTSPVRK